MSWINLFQTLSKAARSYGNSPPRNERIAGRRSSSEPSTKEPEDVDAKLKKFMESLTFKKSGKEFQNFWKILMGDPPYEILEKDIEVLAEFSEHVYEGRYSSAAKAIKGASGVWKAAVLKFAVQSIELATGLSETEKIQKLLERKDAEPLLKFLDKIIFVGGLDEEAKATLSATIPQAKDGQLEKGMSRLTKGQVAILRTLPDAWEEFRQKLPLIEEEEKSEEKKYGSIPLVSSPVLSVPSEQSEDRFGPESGAKPEAKPKAKPESKPKAKPKSKPKSKPKAEPRDKPKNRPESNSGSIPEAKPEADSKDKLKRGPESESRSISEAEPEAKSSLEQPNM